MNTFRSVLSTAIILASICNVHQARAGELTKDPATTKASFTASEHAVEAFGISRYSVSFTDDALTATAFDSDGREVSRLSIDSSSEVLWADLTDGAESLTLPLGELSDKRSCDEVGEAKMRQLLHWMDFFDSAVASGHLKQQADLTDEFGKLYTDFFVSCAASGDETETADKAAVTLRTAEWGLNAYNSQSNQISLWRLNYNSSYQAFCYLSKVQLRDVDTGHENTWCRVSLGGGLWKLQAHAGGSDSDALCRARCIRIRK